LKPFAKFLEVYLVKRGFLDGFHGFAVAVAASYFTFLRVTKIYELERGLIERPSNLRSDYQPQASTGASGSPPR